MASWWTRRRAARLTPVYVGRPAWGYGGPTSDNATESTSVDVLTASAARATKKKIKRGATEAGANSWDQEAWAMYGLVGELRYVANAIAGRMGQAEIYVTRNGKRVDLPEGETDPILDLITPQMIEKMGLNLFVGGAAWLAGLPAKADDEQDDQDVTAPAALAPDAKPADAEAQATWHVFSTVEATKNEKKFTVNGREYDLDRCYPVKVWDPHPAYSLEADSPVRSALPVLRKLVGLDQHLDAQIDSRLAGAGVYWIPSEILKSPTVMNATGEPGQFHENPVLNAIMEAMLLPMQDRDNSAAVVPLLLGAQGDQIANIRFDSFSTPFDERSGELVERNIKRLALCLDAPPELLLGMGDSNHWAAWLVRDEVVQIHVAPRLDLVGDGLTTGFYRPIKAQQEGEDEASAAEYEVHFDVSGLVQRPNRLADASQLHAVDAISDAALREAGGFEESDAPSPQEVALQMALSIGAANPQLLDNMSEIYNNIMAVLDDSPETGPGEVAPSPARQPGSIRRAAPTNGAAPTPAKEAPLVEADSLPQAGAPV